MNRTLANLAGVVAAAAVAAPVTRGASGNFLLIRRDRPVHVAEIAEIGPQRVVHREPGSSWASVPRDQCVAIMNPAAFVAGHRQGWLRLADGQRFPGQALSGARPTEDVLVWNQSTWLGRLEIPLELVESVVFDGPGPAPEPGEADLLLLANGDMLEGFITALGDPISVELLNAGPGGPVSIDLPLGRVSAVRMVTPPRAQEGRRLWLIDGTVVDVDEVMLGDDGFFRLEGLPFVVDDDARRVEMDAVAAVQFDADGLVPFAQLRPRHVEGPPTRYVVPPPRALERHAPLGLSPVEFKGPISVHYVLPSGATHLSAEARLPFLARAWGDCRLVIRNDGREVFSTRLNAETPTAAIGVKLRGPTLTVEITEGSSGPIQDRVVLHRALVLVD